MPMVVLSFNLNNLALYQINGIIRGLTVLFFGIFCGLMVFLEVMFCRLTTDFLGGAINVNGRINLWLIKADRFRDVGFFISDEASSAMALARMNNLNKERAESWSFSEASSR